MNIEGFPKLGERGNEEINKREPQKNSAPEKKARVTKKELAYNRKVYWENHPTETRSFKLWPHMVTEQTLNRLKTLLKIKSYRIWSSNNDITLTVTAEKEYLDSLEKKFKERIEAMKVDI